MIGCPVRVPLAIPIAALLLLSAGAAAQPATGGPPRPGATVQPGQLGQPAQLAQLAQVGPPRRLAPPERTAEPRSTPRPLSVPRRQTVAPPAAAAVPAPGLGGRMKRAVDVVTLRAPDPASVGLIGEGEGGLGVALWRGSDRSLVESLLPRLPIKTPSRAARNLTIRLLTTRAEAPAGSSQGKSLLAMRVERLVALGEVDQASRLAALASADQTDQSLAGAAVEALFLQNDNSGACQRVRRHARRFKENYWQRARAFCLTLSGDRLRAGILADILRERGGPTPDAFFALMEALAGGEEAEVSSLSDPSGLDLAMMRAANARLPADVLSSDRPAVLRGVVGSPNADLDLRLIAGERAFTYGAIDAATLAEIYNAVPFEADVLAKPMTAAEADWGPRGRALLLRSAGSAASSTTKAELLRRAFELAREKGGWDIMLRASAPILKIMTPEPGLLWFARDAVLALLSAGEPGRARLWLELAETDSDAARDAMIRLWAIGRFFGPADTPAVIAPAPFTAWLRAVEAEKTAEGREKAILLMSLLEALGGSAEAGSWASLLAAGQGLTNSGPDVAWMNALNEAASASRVGETVLIALLGLVDAQSGRADTATIRAAVDGLLRVGLVREAKTLALEAAVANGL